MEETVMQQSPTQLSTSVTKITTTENVNVIEVVEHINVLSRVKDANIEFLSPEMMTSKGENLSFSAENLGIPVNGAISLQQEEIEKIKISSDSSVRTEVQNVGIIIENQAGVQELYLDRVYQKAETQEFYCPNCRSCIQKVLIQGTDLEGATTLLPSQPIESIDTFRCTSCFSFLIPIGSWLFPSFVPADEDKASKKQGIEVIEPEIKLPALDQSVAVIEEPLQVEQVVTAVEGTKAKVEGTTAEAKAEGATDEAKVEEGNIEIPEDTARNKAPVAEWENIASTSKATIEPNDQDAIKKGFAAAVWADITSTLRKPQKTLIDSTAKLDGEPADSTTGPVEEAHPTVVTIPEEEVVQQPESSKKWEILKAIVYGGLTESIASLSVVTSAASADATTLSIVALALANLIGGLIILVHHLWEMKSEEFTTTHSETNAEVDRYYMTLGHIDNFILHATVAILSFLVFGLVPPIVYGFAFYESSSKDLKLAAVAAASLVCITLLAIAKAYIQKPTKYVTYFTTIMYYVGSGALASVISYIAGDLIKKLIAKLGWLGSNSNLALPLSEISVGKSGWGSY